MESLTAWSRALRDPQLRDLPYKVETNEFGQLVLSPHKLQHSRRKMQLGDLLRDLIDRQSNVPSNSRSKPRKA